MYLGMSYEDDYPRDSALAVRWYQYCADRGHVFAQRNLARMYADGAGVPRDYVAAYMWANLATAGGAPHAEDILKRVESRMSPGQLAEAQARSSAWKALH
jgi:TPR repeat protein